MKFQNVLLAVKDVEASKKFYGELFGQTVTLDLGKKRDVQRRLCDPAGFCVAYRD